MGRTDDVPAVLATVLAPLPLRRFRVRTERGVVMTVGLSTQVTDGGMDIHPKMRVWVRPSAADPTRGIVERPADTALPPPSRQTEQP